MQRTTDRPLSPEIVLIELHSYVVVTVIGTWTAGRTAQLRRALADAVERQRPMVIVDLSRVVFVDPAAIETVVAELRRRQMTGEVIAVVRPSGPERHLLASDDVDSQLAIHGSVAEAAASRSVPHRRPRGG